MKSKITFYLVVGFVVFLIWRDAAGTGETANSFLDWLGTALQRTHEFITKAIGDGDSSG